MDRQITKVVNIHREKYDLYIGRPSIWGNPWSHIKDRNTLAKFQCDTREEAIAKYREYIENGAGMHLLAKLPMLKGKTLGCFCNVDKGEHCHGEVLIELIKKYCV